MTIQSSAATAIKPASQIKPKAIVCVSLRRPRLPERSLSSRACPHGRHATLQGLPSAGLENPERSLHARRFI